MSIVSMLQELTRGEIKNSLKEITTKERKFLMIWKCRTTYLFSITIMVNQ